jgi:hypothetical protein
MQPMLIDAVSRMSQGDKTYDLELTDDSAIEPRRKGANGIFTVVFNFDRPVVAAAASLSGIGSVSGPPAISENQVTVELAGIADAQILTLNLSGVTSKDGGPTGSASVTWKVLHGDVTQDGVVGAADVQYVKSALSYTLNALNAICDVDCSGATNTGDVLVTKAKRGARLP